MLERAQIDSKQCKNNGKCDKEQYIEEGLQKQIRPYTSTVKYQQIMTKINRYKKKTQKRICSELAYEFDQPNGVSSTLKKEQSKKLFAIFCFPLPRVPLHLRHHCCRCCRHCQCTRGRTDRTRPAPSSGTSATSPRCPPTSLPPLPTRRGCPTWSVCPLPSQAESTAANPPAALGCRKTICACEMDNQIS